MRPSVSPVLVGRVPELARLNAAADTAAAGQAGSVFIGGDAGLGKSRLVQSFAQQRSVPRPRILIGHCLDLGDGELPFAPLTEALRGSAGDMARWWLPADSPPGPITGTEAPAASQATLFEHVLQTLQQLADKSPLVLVVEDLHWVDRSTLDLLTFLHRALTSEPVLLIGTYRSSDLPGRPELRRVLSELERHSRCDRFELGPLTEEEMATLVDHLAGPGASQGRLGRVVDRCDGNPFFAEELLANPATALSSLPRSVREAVLSRVDRIPPVSRDVLRAAAVAGRRVTHRLLSSVAGLPGRELSAAVRDCVEASLLEVDVDTQQYVFRHSLAREAVYTELLPGERAHLHSRCAQELQDHPALSGVQGAAAAVELAHHWFQAAEISQALTASLQAAVAARDAIALTESHQQYERAVVLA